MRVLLIYPEFPDTFWSYSYVLRAIGRKSLAPPLGLLTVAAMLPDEWEVRLIDLNVGPLSDKELAWADCAFISGMTVQREYARKIIQRCKAAGKTVVAGGPLFTGEYALFQEVDHFVLNEGELTLPPFLADFKKGVARRVYRSREFADMTQSPVPRWDLVNRRHYAFAPVQYSRGCPFNCDFCNVTSLLGRQPRVKTSGQIIAELDSLQDHGWRGQTFFVDDNLIGNRQSLKDDLLPALIQWQKGHGPMPFITQASINPADDEVLTGDMVRAGFDMVFVGIETPDAGSLAECGKNQNRNRDLVEDVKRLQRAGLEVQGGFILGFDHDTPATFRRQVDFIQRSGIATAMVGLLQAPPGTRLARRLEGEGRLMGYSSGDNTDGSTNILPTMGEDALREGYAWVLKNIYSPGPYYRRLKAFLREYHQSQYRMSIDLSRLRAFFHSIYDLGIKGSERVHYWYLLIWTLLHRPTLIPTAVRLAICGHHYRLVCQQHGLMR